MADLGQGLNSVSGNTSAHLILDVGRMWEDIDLDALRASGTGQIQNATEGAGARQMGATRGGASFETGKEVRFLEIDGRRYPLRGLSRIDQYEPSLTIQILEQTEENMQRLLGNTDLDEHDAYHEYSLSLVVKDTDYLDNVAIITALSSINTLVVIVLENALSVDSVEFPLEDRNEAVTETRFVGHALDSAPDESPFRLFYPVTASS